MRYLISNKVEIEPLSMETKTSKRGIVYKTKVYNADENPFSSYARTVSFTILFNAGLFQVHGQR